jgi:hypothetical protein
MLRAPITERITGNAVLCFRAIIAAAAAHQLLIPRPPDDYPHR